MPFEIQQIGSCPSYFHYFFILLADYLINPTNQLVTKIRAIIDVNRKYIIFRGIKQVELGAEIDVVIAITKVMFTPASGVNRAFFIFVTLRVYRLGLLPKITDSLIIDIA